MNQPPNIKRSPVSPGQYWLPALLLLIGFTLLHLISLAGYIPLFTARDAIFFADASDYTVLTRQPTIGFSGAPLTVEEGYVPRRDMKGIDRFLNRSDLLNKMRKHPLFIPVNHLCYRAWKSVAHRFHPQWSIEDEQRALLFPSAFFGGLAVAGFYLFLRRQSRDLPTPLLFAMLFGCSLGRWVYASLPETYSLQVLLTVGLTALIFRLRPGRAAALVLGLALAVAMLTGMNNILLTVPLFLFFLFNGKPLRGLACCVVAFSAVAIAYALLAHLVDPQLSLVESLRLSGSQVISHSPSEVSLLFKRLISVAGNHFFFSIGALHIPQAHFTRPAALLTYFQSPLPALFLVLYLVFLMVLGRQLLTGGLPSPRDRGPVLLCWLAVHFLFYAVFNSAQPFLYTQLFLVPLITLFYLIWSNHRGSESAGWGKLRLGLLSLLVLVTFLDNQLFLSRVLLR